MKITIKNLMEVRRYYRENLKALGRGIIEDILLEEDPDRRYGYNFHSTVKDYCEYIVSMNLEDILVEAGIFNIEKEIEI